ISIMDFPPTDKIHLTTALTQLLVGFAVQGASMGRRKRPLLPIREDPKDHNCPSFVPPTPFPLLASLASGRLRPMGWLLKEEPKIQLQTPVKSSRTACGPAASSWAKETGLPS